MTSGGRIGAASTSNPIQRGAPARPIVTSLFVGFPRRAIALVLGFTPGAVLACACGCDVFDVGTATMLPSRPGSIVFIEDDYMNQNENWVGSHSAPAAL